MREHNAIPEPGWNFDNSYARLPEVFYSKVTPTPVRLPKLVVLNEPLAAALGLDIQALKNDRGLAVLAGNELPEGAAPLAQAYAGHQFGHFTKLGDGRAILLGEQRTPQGTRFDVQLKGPGRTPYSRQGDGRAALGPMLREYIISEAMHALGIPTTRSLAVVTTGETVHRETGLPGAILTRVASSHLRVGTFQYAAHWGEAEELRALADYTWERHFSEADPGENRYLSLLREVIERQASLIAKWQLVGFIHGVMNTDNMALSGETIDYGPCAFMDAYDPATVFSSIDRHGRYAYGNQPEIAAWNLARFAEALLPLLHEDEEQAVKLAETALGDFAERFHHHWLGGMRAKLGLFNEEPEDVPLIKRLLGVMYKTRADYTNTFRALSLDRPTEAALESADEFAAWRKEWQARQGRQEESAEAAQALMRRSNPAVIPRNHRVEEALEAAVERGDTGVMERLLAVLAKPYDYGPEQEEYCGLPDPSGRPYRTFCGT
ncbi:MULTISPECIES: protein adenylyltransferase SelO [Paenibacillus]|uniref:protein adenylyltransferase SelO n=1 Tax=Paenibacillus TaxID=44249 RepID=UPI002FE22C74